jgi:hypothetical protein
LRPENSREHIAQLVAGKVSVPVSEMPRLENSRITGWNPATASRADGSQWMIAFTTEEGASKFCDGNPDFGFYVTVDTTWALSSMPPNHGIVFDLGTEDMFTWNAQGLAKYKKDVLGWE